MFWFDITICLTLLSATAAQYSRPNSDSPCATSCASKKRLSTAFHPQTNSQTKGQNRTIEVYLRAFVNYKQDNWAIFLLMAEFVYNKSKNASIMYTLFELNCRYHLRVSYKKYIDPHFRFKTDYGLIEKLSNLMSICRVKPQHV